MRSCRCAPARVGNHSHRHRIAGNPRGPASFPSVRDISCDDGPAKPGVALISASLARAVFPPGNEIGQHIRIAAPDRREVEVIGVVADAPYVKLDDPTPLVVFRPITQETART